MFSNQKKEYYSILNVSKNASQEEIKKAFRKLAYQYHPDHNAGDKSKEKKFKEINEAYDILGDPKKRAQYDQFGFVDEQGGNSGYPSGGSDNFKDVFGDFEDIFDNFFGGSRSSSSNRRSSRVQRGQDLILELEISFEDSFLGREVTISLPKNLVCSTCQGDGMQKGYSKTTCKVCNGSGALKKSQGFFTFSSDCYQCKGIGEIIENPCSTCHGVGLIKGNKNILVKIPKGIETGNKIKISNEGDSVVNGQNGDLYIQVKVRKHDFFIRKDLDLFYNQSILFSQAVLGDEIIISTLEEKLRLKIPPGTQNNHLFRFKNQGFFKINSTRKGDLYVRVNIIIPEDLTLEQRLLLEQFADLRGDSYQKNSSFYERIKKKFN